MKHISQLTDFYYKNLYPVLELLEKERKEVRAKIIKLAIIYNLISFAIIIFIFNEMHGNINALMFFLFLYFGLGRFLYKQLIKKYSSEFKEKIIRPLIQEIDASLHYSPLLHIPSHHFRDSKLFRIPDRESGNDYVQGTIDGINIEFSDYHAEKKSKDSKGRTSWSTIFEGLFIVSQFPKNFQGETLVTPDITQSLFGTFLGNFLQSSFSGKHELIIMDNVAFEKEFVVYGSDQVEARYILTPVLMEKLLAYRRNVKADIYISFRKQNIYLAIEYKKDLFEPSVFDSLLKYEIAMEYVQTLHLAIGIVEELKLNKKLWSKY